MKIEQESSKYKNFIEITPKSPYKPISKLHSTNIIFSRKINLSKNDYFKDFGLKKNNQIVNSFHSSNEETNPTLNTQRRMNSDIYERLRKEEENFIKTLLRLKQKMNNSQTNSTFHISDNKTFSSKNINSNQNNSNLISININNKNKKEKPIKITSYNNKVKINDTRNKKNLSSNSIPNHSSISSKYINEYKNKNKSNTIINKIDDIFKTRTLNILSKKKESNKNNSIKVQSTNKSSNISKDSINQLYKKNFVHEYQIKKKTTYDLSMKFNFKNNVPVAVIDLSDNVSIKNIKCTNKKGNKLQINKKIKI